MTLERAPGLAVELAALVERWPPMRALVNRVSPSEIPASRDILSAGELERRLARSGDPPPSILAVGDIMLGARARSALGRHGWRYPFEAVAPLLGRAGIVVGNLEGPLARKARREPRTHSYRSSPDVAVALKQAGIDVVTLANNHLVDCGRAGVVETLEILDAAGIATLGAGLDKQRAHLPVVRRVGDVTVGLLGYYWNRRCAATRTLPGSAMDPPEALEADIRRLRARVDRVVVTFHWGVPYEREPSPEDRAKARHAAECGADVVVGHHPHVVQPFEIHAGCPIFYSVGNFAFGSGNSRAEGIMLAVAFDEDRITVDVYPLYVKNRDLRVDYQPKVLGGEGGRRVLQHLVDVSGPHGSQLEIDEGRGRLRIARAAAVGAGRMRPHG